MKLPYVGQFNAHQPKLPAANNPFNNIANGNDVPKPDQQQHVNANNAAAPVPNDQQANQQQQFNQNAVGNQINSNENQKNNLQLQQEQKKQMISGSKLIKISSKNNMGLSAAAKVSQKANQQKQDSGESKKFSNHNASKEKMQQQHSENSFGNPAFVQAVKDKDSSQLQKDQGMAAKSYSNDNSDKQQQQAAQSNNNSLEKKSQNSSKRMAGVAGMSHRSSARSRKSGRIGIQNQANQQDKSGFQEDGTQVKGGFFCCSSGTRTNGTDGQQDESGCTIF